MEIYDQLGFFVIKKFLVCMMIWEMIVEWFYLFEDEIGCKFQLLVVDFLGKFGVLKLGLLKYESDGVIMDVMYEFVEEEYIWLWIVSQLQCGKKECKVIDNDDFNDLQGKIEGVDFFFLVNKCEEGCEIYWWVGKY